MATAQAVAALSSHLKSHKGFKKDMKQLQNLLEEVLSHSNEADWMRDDLGTLIIDPLILDVLPKIAGTTVTERECLSLVHKIASKAMLPVSNEPSQLRPMFRFESQDALQAEVMSPQADAWVKQLAEGELNDRGDQFRWNLALQTLGCLSESGHIGPQARKRIGDVCRQILLGDTRLARVSAPISKPDKTGAVTVIINTLRRSSALGGEGYSGFESEEDKDLAVQLCRTCLICARKSLPEGGPALYEHVAMALGAVRSDIARLAMDFFLRACAFDVERVQREFVFRLPPLPGTIDLTDLSACRSFARIMLALSSSPTDKSFQALAMLVRDSRPEVNLLAAQLLAELPWEWLVDHQLPPRQADHKNERDRRQHAGNGIRLIPEIIYRLSESLSAGSQVLIMAACVATWRLARTRNDWVGEDTVMRVRLPDPFFGLSQKLSTLCLDSQNQAIKQEASIALCWVGRPATLADRIWTDRDASRLVDAIIGRSEKTPSMELLNCLLQTVYALKELLDGKSIQKAMLCSLHMLTDSTFTKRMREKGLATITRYIISMIDWASDTRNVASETALFGILVTEWPFRPFYSPNTCLSFALRLERALRIRSVQSVQKAAALALIRIGIICGEPTRIRIYEILKEFFNFSIQESFERDHPIRSDMVGPALRMFDQVYSLLIAQEADEDKYTDALATARLLCTGLGEDFSFLSQAKDMLIEASSEGRGGQPQKGDEDASLVTRSEDENEVTPPLPDEDFYLAARSTGIARNAIARPAIVMNNPGPIIGEYDDESDSEEG